MSNRVWQSTASTDASLAANYSGNTFPVSGDTVTLATLGSVATAALATNLPSYTNALGLTWEQKSNFASNVGAEASGTNGATYLAFGVSGSSTVFIGKDEGNPGGGSPLTLISGGNSSSGTTSFYVYKTGSKTGSFPACCLKGSACKLYIFDDAEVGFAIRPGDTGAASTIVLGKTETGSGTPILRIGSGATITASPVIQDGGLLYNHSATTFTAVTVIGQGSKFINEADATITLTALVLQDGASAILKGPVTITAATIRANCTLKLDDRQAKVIGTIYADEGSFIDLDNGDASSISGSGTNYPWIVINGDASKVKISKPVGLNVLLM